MSQTAGVPPRRNARKPGSRSFAQGGSVEKFKVGDRVRAVGIDNTEASVLVTARMRKAVNDGRVMKITRIWSVSEIDADGGLWHPSDLRKVRGRKK